MTFLENKIPPPLVALIIASGMWWLSTFTTTVLLTSDVKFTLMSVFIAIAIFFELSGLLSFRLARTTINPLKPERTSTLVTSGIYQFTRNPMYVGLAALLFAWTSYLASVWGISLIVVYVAYIQRFQIVPEERALTTLFENEFIAYKNKVRAWL